MIAGPGRLVLLGSPVAHSLSPVFQNAALRSAGMHRLRYEAIDVAPEDLERTFASLRSERAAGNVTVPHKEAAFALCAFCLPVAERAGAVNTFWTNTNGDLIGTNTDVGGFDVSARGLLGDAHAGAKIALLGAGGAARAVLTAVERWPGAEVVLWNRTGERAEELAQHFSVVKRVEQSTRDAVREATCVVNATAIGRADDSHPISLDDVPASAAIIDLVYRRGNTPWVRDAVARGMPAIDGLPMLLEQGALAFQEWFHCTPPREIMRGAITW